MEEQLENVTVPRGIHLRTIRELSAEDRAAIDRDIEQAKRTTGGRLVKGERERIALNHLITPIAMKSYLLGKVKKKTRERKAGTQDDPTPSFSCVVNNIAIEVVMPSDQRVTGVRMQEKKIVLSIA